MNCSTRGTEHALTKPNPSRSTARTATALLLAGSTILLGGCGRDTSGAEQLAAMNAAATRAEKAAERAEQALAKIEKAGQPVMVDAEPEATEEPEDTAVADANEPPPEPEIKG